MIAVLQRVAHARVRVGDRETGSIKHGLLVLLGIARGDGAHDVQWMAQRIAALRIFHDDGGKMNLDIRQVHGSILLVSQFTLLADLSGGNRPGWSRAEEPAIARVKCEEVQVALVREGIPVSCGEFGAAMRVELENDGPVTIVLDSASMGGSASVKR
ncbi:MAG: D-tyrosyl-tRNA(Tyr) deacylase [Phycisphaerales bacterium]|nr:D-tyrosyl-tRNA(Tyr) deacylase [Phycisphaerales bacterium]